MAPLWGRYKSSISQIMVESMFKAAMGDIERFNRKFMILSKEMQVIIILTRFLLLYLGASLSAEARDKGYVQKWGVIARFVR